MTKSPKIYIVATPIGNLEDLSPRARRVLAGVDLIAAEDTRQTAKLLAKLGIAGKQLVSYHDHGEERRAEELVDRLLAEGGELAVVSDAGTPGIADPGYRIAARARALGVELVPIPGPSSLTSLVSVSGLPSDRLLFLGFLPNRSEALRREISAWPRLGASVVCFEAARRLVATLKLMSELLPDATLVIGRELTKTYEEVRSFSVHEALVWASGHSNLKGEVTLMISPGAPPFDREAVRATVKKLAYERMAEGHSHKDVVTALADCGLERKELYKLVLAVFQGTSE